MTLTLNPKVANQQDRKRGLPVLLDRAPLDARLRRIAGERGCSINELLSAATRRAMHRAQEEDLVQAHCADRILCEVGLQWWEVWPWGGDAELYFTGEISS